MPETLLTPSNILLFGRVVEDLQISAAPAGAEDGLPAAGALEQQLRAPGANFARIYGFGIERAYLVLPTPVLLLVHGPGAAAAEIVTQLQPEAPEAGEAGGATGPELPKDMMVWAYDKADFTIRLEARTGTFEQLLAAASPAGALEAAGMSAQGMSVSGMSVTGMSAQGMSVLGMSVTGMSVSSPPKE